ncbi:unnamed protein product [Effrenium voratum]|uniref:Uncharacterized protein n=1 Tax=Effrenium voratum TaxID=2562239 RepID=A0AA36JHJ1_9DINO|nr:unnamed protein product [Effrenium voratum]CAJ1449492.1 unnamed protein product [Effrenium voratum]
MVSRSQPEGIDMSDMTMAADPAPDPERGQPKKLQGPMPRHVWEQRAPPRWRLCGMHMEEEAELVHRAARRMEGLRLCLQFQLVMGLTLLLAGMLLSAYLHEPLLRVPVRCWEDTFGPVSRIWHFEPPTLDRPRFEEPQNFWRPVTFGAASFPGQAQDLAFSAWNWTVTGLYKGPWYLRLVSLGILALGSLPFCFVYGGPWEVKWCCEKYLMYMPEQMLILHQLKVAHEVFGRKLSAEAEAELEAFMEWKNANL